MPRVFRVVAAVLSIAMLVSVTALAVLGAQSERFLDWSEDNFKVQFISGNLTASITRDWPRVDFQHSANLFAPMFEIGMNRMFLFNDTNGDGVFSRSEAIYTSLLDSSKVGWNMSSIDFEPADSGGEFAAVSMSATTSLYEGYVNQTIEKPDISDWANITFRFIISEAPVTFTNSLGEYIVAGKTDLQIRMTVEVLKKVDASGLALEQVLQAGGSVYLFLLRERASKSDATVLTPVSARVDERGQGLTFTHRLQQTSLPTQDIEFAKDDGTVQAYYRFSSEPTTEVNGTARAVSLNSSYYTTGTGLVLCPAYSLSNQTDNLVHDMSIGLDMSGFVRVRDWAAKNLPVLAIVCGGLVALTGTSVHLWKRKRRMLLENGEDTKTEIEKSGPK